MIPFQQLTFEDFLKDIEIPKMGIRTGFSSLDKAILGFHPGRLYVLGGTSGMGKSAILVDFILAAAKEVPVGMLSLEMNLEELKERMVFRIADLHSQRINSGKIEQTDKREIEEAIGTISKLNKIAILEDANYFYPEWILKKGTWPTDSIEAVIRDWSEQGCKILFIDYLQMAELQQKTDRDDLKIKEMATKLKRLAKQYQIAIVVAAQLKGAVEDREDKTPVLNDLWGSTFIKNNADVVMLLYRPEYYSKKREVSFLFERSKEDAKIIIAKNRHGITCSIEVYFKPYCCSFCDKENDFLGE